MTEHWLVQSEYDFETALTLRAAQRNVYSVYMCHLSLEKLLKGLFVEITSEIPPKTHNLILLLNRSGKKPPEEIGRFFLQLNDASIATRYPEDFSLMLATYTDVLTDTIIRKTREAIAWTKTQLLN